MLKWLTELRETLYVLMLVYCKGFHSRPSKGKKWLGKERERLLCPRQAHHLPSTTVCLPPWKISETSWFIVFMEVPLYRHDWLNYWLLMIKGLPWCRTTYNMGDQVQSLGRKNLLEKEMAPHSSTLAWKIPWMEEPARLTWGRKESDMTEWLHFHFSFIDN